LLEFSSKDFDDMADPPPPDDDDFGEETFDDPVPGDFEGIVFMDYFLFLIVVRLQMTISEVLKLSFFIPQFHFLFRASPF
jgi:hypothetical protein